MSIAHIKATLDEARNALEGLRANEAALRSIEDASTAMIRALEGGGRIFSCGNGGSMCDAMHFAEELTGRYRKNRAGVSAVAISDPGYLSCVANDFGYDQVFSRYVESHGRRGDALLAISTSGKSPNVLNAAKAARGLHMQVVALTGSAGSELEGLADVCVSCPGGDFADRTQELHIKVIHLLIELIERRFFPANY